MENSQFTFPEDAVGNSKTIKPVLVEKKHSNKGFLKYLFIGIVILILVILSSTVKSKIYEREYTSDNASYDISQAAGGNFVTDGLYITIPYVSKDSVYINGKYSKTGEIIVYTKKSKYYATITSENRNLGIYSSPVFTGTLKVEGDFDLSDYVSTDTITYELDKASVGFNIKDTSLCERPVLFINNEKYETKYDSVNKGVISNINLSGVNNIQVSSLLNIRGASNFNIIISGSETELEIKSDWKSPGFTNCSYLPNSRNINDEGFFAKWIIPFDSGDKSHSIGFAFVQPVDLYTKLLRSVSYSILFIIVPFLVLFLFEVFAKINLHPMHYLLCGAATVLFFLLLLSISEHLSFGLSYLIGAFAAGMLVSLYVRWITNGYKYGIIMSVVFCFLYTYLYVCLKSEDYALLMGSIFAFVLLAVVMFVTRKINWANLKKNADTDLI